MKHFFAVLAVFVMTMSAGVSYAKRSPQTDPDAAGSARAAFEEILDLWREGRYDELYERTQRSGKTAQEDFAARLDNGTYKPACCWQKLQDVTVHVENNDFAVIRAKIGLEGGSDISYKTRSWKLVREGAVWRISQSDLFALSGAKKSVKRKQR